MRQLPLRIWRGKRARISLEADGTLTLGWWPDNAVTSPRLKERHGCTVKQAARFAKRHNIPLFTEDTR